MIPHSRTGSWFPRIVTISLLALTGLLLVTGSMAAGTARADALPGIAIADTFVTEGDAGLVEVPVVVSLSAASQDTVAVGFQTMDGTAQAGSDYLPQSGTLWFAPGTLRDTLLVAVLGDLLPEPYETFQVVLSDPLHATLADTTATVLIVENDPPALTAADASVAEGDSGATWVVASLTPTYFGPDVSVHWHTEDGTATAADGDYVPASGTLPIVVFEPTGVAIEVRGDTRAEPDETFRVVFSDAANATFVDSVAIVTILNDDGTTAVADGQGQLPLALHPIVPNPGSGPTRIDFQLATATAIRLAVFDVAGRQVALLAGGVWPAGRHQVTWGETNGRSSPAPGHYLVQLAGGGRSVTRRLVIRP